MRRNKGATGERELANLQPIFQRCPGFKEMTDPMADRIDYEN